MTIIFDNHADAAYCLAAYRARFRVAHMEVRGHEFHVVCAD